MNSIGVQFNLDESNLIVDGSDHIGTVSENMVKTQKEENGADTHV